MPSSTARSSQILRVNATAPHTCFHPRFQSSVVRVQRQRELRASFVFTPPHATPASTRQPAIFQKVAVSHQCTPSPPNPQALTPKASTPASTAPPPPPPHHSLSAGVARTPAGRESVVCWQMEVEGWRPRRARGPQGLTERASCACLPVCQRGLPAWAASVAR